VNLSELFDLTQWIDREIKGKQIRDRYQNLQSILQANTGPNRTKQPFENEKNELIAAISTVPLESLSMQFVKLRRFCSGTLLTQPLRLKNSPKSSKKSTKVFRNRID